MRKYLRLGLTLTVLAPFAASPAALANGNPSGTGPPDQSCQNTEASGGQAPGNSSSSPGSPFNEPGTNSQNGGTGGQHYNEQSQYDVACYQVSQNH